ncbi:hypothetical protein ONA23_03090 [Mycoplasmopsis cynos]|uniref:hypothetical protein n=1 Tax=Mycoplasmopsis cynos TaxID=171284 RepID=UPI0024C978DD|nr:hypothetical protein [Mycoplasmopsis cynos]WAM07105.1 hypothetical protein ONA23_03090 [Mycoplasmopsis cynos]
MIFLSFYNSYAPEELKNNINDDSQKNDNKKKPESLFKLDFSKPQKTFKLNHKITFNVYVKNINNNFELDSENVKLDKNAKYTFDKQYKLSDISYITSNDEKSVNISQLSTLFINFKTHQMTFDSIKGSEWENIDGAIKVFGDELAGLLGFKRIKNSEFVYELDKSEICHSYRYKKWW